MVKIIDGLNIYSPEMLIQNDKLVMYFGGWLTQSDMPHDSIFRVELSSPTTSGTPEKILIPSNGVVQINDPTLIYMPGGFWLMYMTGSTSLNGELSDQGVYYATSWDGKTWSPPFFLMNGYWLPSVVLKNERVYLYVNSTVNGLLYRFDLGTSGVSVSEPVLLSIPFDYVNIDVVYHPSIDLWQMMGENLGEFNSSSKIDYLYSLDGLYFVFGKTVINTNAGESVRTPAMHPHSAYYCYFGKSPTRDGLHNDILFKDWSP